MADLKPSKPVQDTPLELERVQFVKEISIGLERTTSIANRHGVSLSMHYYGVLVSKDKLRVVVPLSNVASIQLK